ncbi:MAG: archaellin/type IV pilin N-terminal domain-containing protein, partial [Candidatus Bathyarchaeia archaeon]
MNGILRHNQKAVSPVIATIIIVAVAIVMSIAVAYWMLGLATTFTRYEKLEFISAYAVKDAGAN